MRDAEIRYINQNFHADAVLPEKMDELWANGWRHFGTHFYRYNIGFLHFDIRDVIPLRVRLSNFQLSKSQRRALRSNSDLNIEIRPIRIDSEVEALFDRHKQRFDHGVPESIFDFVSRDPAISPCEAKELRVSDGDRLLAVSYFDIGLRATSGLYAMFEPVEAKRGLGIYTMLKEIEYGIENGKEFYYQGYCYEGESFYDYKKRLQGTEAYDWEGDWRRFTTETPRHREAV